MCHSTVNRRNVLRVITDGDVAGVTLLDCATDIVAKLQADVSSRHKVLDILQKLQQGGEIVFRSAVLIRLSNYEKRVVQRNADEAKRVRRATLSRTAAHRHGGVRGLTPVEFDIPQNPIPRAWWGFDPRHPKGVTLKSDPIPPAGGWADDVVDELSRLEAEQRDDLDGRCGCFDEICCGLSLDLIEAGLDQPVLVG